MCQSDTLFHCVARVIDFDDIFWHILLTDWIKKKQIIHKEPALIVVYFVGKYANQHKQIAIQYSASNNDRPGQGFPVSGGI